MHNITTCQENHLNIQINNITNYKHYGWKYPYATFF